MLYVFAVCFEIMEGGFGFEGTVHLPRKSDDSQCENRRDDRFPRFPIWFGLAISVAKRETRVRNVAFELRAQ